MQQTNLTSFSPEGTVSLRDILSFHLHYPLQFVCSLTFLYCWTFRGTEAPAIEADSQVEALEIQWII